MTKSEIQQCVDSKMHIFDVTMHRHACKFDSIDDTHVRIYSKEHSKFSRIAFDKFEIVGNALVFNIRK